LKVVHKLLYYVIFRSGQIIAFTYSMYRHLQPCMNTNKIVHFIAMPEQFMGGNMN